jgi:uncharacterized membrane protein
VADNRQLCGELPIRVIIWLNHHHLMRFVSHLTPGLIWINFAHLFFVSFLPFSTAWVAATRLASSPVVLCSVLLVCVDVFGAREKLPTCALQK